MAYTKLDSGITESTIWQAPDTTRLVWITMLARADQHGYIGASVPGLAGLARVSMDACIAALKLLEAPDEWSRTKDHEGRRIAPADGGWVLLNHAKYRSMQSADDRRERSRLAMADLRNKRKQELTVNTSYQSYPKLAQAEAEAEEEKEKTCTAHASRFAEFWALWPKSVRKGSKAECAKVWKARGFDSKAELVFSHVKAMKETQDWRKDGGQFIPAPVVYLRGERWDGAEVEAESTYSGAV